VSLDGPGALTVSGNNPQKMEMFLEQYSISGSIDENLPLRKFDVTIFDYVNKYKVANISVNTDVDPAFQMFFAPPGPVQVTVTPRASIWEPNKAIIAGDVIFATDPTITPYYFIVSVGGTTGAVEPAWVTSAGNVIDNTVTYAWSGGMIAPVTNAPLIPQLVV